MTTATTIELPAFRPASLETLARWIFRDLAGGGPVMGIPRENIVLPGARLISHHFGRSLAAPLGVAAGPHTQLTQNIVASWLCGARFIELKTVQVLDEIHVARPCIDAADEGYNCEWSQELRIDQSADEYINAWVLIHALARHFGIGDPGVIFSMSVGYDLAGIQGPKVQRFLQRLTDATSDIAAAVEALARVDARFADLVVPSAISNQVTLSTMHGCPPAEIERIARYLLTEKRLHTWVKLNPTLLGPKKLRALLNEQAEFDIEVPDAAFGHDPVYEDALPMVLRLDAVARELQAASDDAPTFGIKLSNTLEVVNKRPIFPPTEKMMYLSGRALHPLTLTLAHQIRTSVGPALRLSFCGGADATNFADLIADGLGPVTVCTDLLKPGGYARLSQYLDRLDAAMTAVGADDLDAFMARSHAAAATPQPEAVAEPKAVAQPEAAASRNLSDHAARVGGERRYQQRTRQLKAKGPRPLATFDCINAPCVDACPSHQDIPKYLAEIAAGRPEQSFNIIARTNAMPGVTGSVCDHPCVDRCVLNHYEGPLAIRQSKRFAVEHAGPMTTQRLLPVRLRDATLRAEHDALMAEPPKVAIVGGGPAGLAAAYFLARASVPSVVFEARPSSGGMVSHTIPPYRLDDHATQSDLDRARSLGVVVKHGHRLGRELTLAGLRQDYAHVVLALGAQADKKLGIPGDDSPSVLNALGMLERVCAGEIPALGRRVLVVGGGNSAMDAARTARRLVPDGEVSLVYRRTRAQMPADPHEVESCMEEGIGIKDLLAPVRIETAPDGTATFVCQRMTLGPLDESGRPRPVPVANEFVHLPYDTLIPAIGQDAVIDFAAEGLKLKRNGTVEVAKDTLETTLPGVFAAGDIVHGPLSVIQGIGDGLTVAKAIATRLGRELAANDEPEDLLQSPASELMVRRSSRTPVLTVPELPVAQRASFTEVLGTMSAEDAQAEAARCLQCDTVCSLCVTVCPNRAMQAFEVAPVTFTLPSFAVRGDVLVAEGSTRLSVAQAVQILNITDFCNQCGDCTSFCPTAGEPWKEKPNFWLDAEGYGTATGDKYRMTRTDGGLLLEAHLGGRDHRLEESERGLVYDDGRARVRLSPDGRAVLEVSAIGPLADGETVTLETCSRLVVLLSAAPVLPI
jgi:putative selenate reductase